MYLFNQCILVIRFYCGNYTCISTENSYQKRARRIISDLPIRLILIRIFSLFVFFRNSQQIFFNLTQFLDLKTVQFVSIKRYLMILSYHRKGVEDHCEGYIKCCFPLLLHRIIWCPLHIIDMAQYWSYPPPVLNTLLKTDGFLHSTVHS